MFMVEAVQLRFTCCRFCWHVSTLSGCARYGFVANDEI